MSNETPLYKPRVKIVTLKKMNYTNFDNITGQAELYTMNFDYKFLEEELDYFNSVGLLPLNFTMEDVPEGSELGITTNWKSNLGSRTMLGNAVAWRIDNKYSSDIGFRRAKINCIEQGSFVSHLP